MDIVTKIITLIGGIIGLVSAVSIMFGVKEIRSGMSNDDPRLIKNKSCWWGRYFSNWWGSRLCYYTGRSYSF